MKQEKQEIWKDIPGYEGLYQVSNFGRVRSMDHTVSSKRGWTKFVKGRIMKPSKHHYGYLVVSLLKSLQSKQFAVHVLVGRAFIPNPDNLPCINHIDEDKRNNHVENLEWCTLQYNNEYGTRVERIKLSQRNDPKKSKPVKQLTLDNELVNTFPSIAEASRVIGVSEGVIAGVCKKKPSHFTAGGFKWEFA